MLFTRPITCVDLTVTVSPVMTTQPVAVALMEAVAAMMMPMMMIQDVSLQRPESPFRAGSQSQLRNCELEIKYNQVRIFQYLQFRIKDNFVFFTLML